MKNFRSILYVSRATGDEIGSLKQAMSVARNNEAELRALVVCPDLPADFGTYREAFEQSLEQALASRVAQAREAIHLSEADLEIAIDVDPGAKPADRSIRRALRQGADLLVKEADRKDGGRGYRAMDMELLRKCPCALWLGRPIERHRHQIRVAVAVDPEHRSGEARDLSIRLLEVAHSLAETCDRHLSVISCWDYPMEDYLRGNPWMKVSAEQLREHVEHSQTTHRQHLDELLREAGVADACTVRHIRGEPDKAIPAFVAENSIDILVMGTIARTGVAGLLIGNTAENTVQNLECSLLALKPNGFVSPVRAYD